MDFIKDQLLWIMESIEVEPAWEFSLTAPGLLESNRKIEVWLSAIVAIVEEQTKNILPLELPIKCQQMLYRWTLISSALVGDFTVRNAPSFGPFHLLQKLSEEYVHFLLDAKLSQAQEVKQDFDGDWSDLAQSIDQDILFTDTLLETAVSKRLKPTPKDYMD